MPRFPQAGRLDQARRGKGVEVWDAEGRTTIYRLRTRGAPKLRVRSELTSLLKLRRTRKCEVSPAVAEILS